MGGSYREETRCARGAVGRSGRSGGRAGREVYPSGEHVCPFRPPDRLTARPPWHAPCSISHQIPRLIRRDTVVPYHTIAFSQQKLRAALRRSLGPGARVQLRVRDPLPPPQREAHPRRDHPARARAWRSASSCSRGWTGFRSGSSATRGSPSGPGTRWRGRVGQGQRRPPAADLAGHAHLHLRHQLRAHPAPGAGGGAGEGREPGAAAHRADARAAGDVAVVARRRSAPSGRRAA